MSSERIEKISIPDADVPDWMATLREAGFTDQEIDDTLSHLNGTYAGIKRNEVVNRELAKMEEEVRSRRGNGFTPEEAEQIKKGIESRFNSPSEESESRY